LNNGGYSPRNIAVRDAQTLDLIQTLAIDNLPFNGAQWAGGTFANGQMYVAVSDFSQPYPTIISISTSGAATSLGLIETPGDPWDIRDLAFDETRNVFYLSDQTDNSIHVVNTAFEHISTHSLLGFSLGSAVQGIFYDPDEDRIVADIAGSSWLYKIDPVDFSETATIELDILRGPSIAYAGETGIAFTTDSGESRAIAYSSLAKQPISSLGSARDFNFGVMTGDGSDSGYFTPSSSGTTPMEQNNPYVLDSNDTNSRKQLWVIRDNNAGEESSTPTTYLPGQADPAGNIATPGFPEDGMSLDWWSYAGSNMSYVPGLGVEIPDGFGELIPTNTGDNANWNNGITPDSIQITVNNQTGAPTNLNAIVEFGATLTTYYEFVNQQIPVGVSQINLPNTQGPEPLDDLNWEFTINDGGDSTGFYVQSVSVIPDEIPDIPQIHMIAIDGESRSDKVEVWTGVNGVWDFGTPNDIDSGRVVLDRLGLPSGNFPKGPLYISACVNNTLAGNEFEYKVRVKGSGNAPFSYPVPIGYNDFGPANQWLWVGGANPFSYNNVTDEYTGLGGWDATPRTGTDLETTLISRIEVDFYHEGGSPLDYSLSLWAGGVFNLGTGVTSLAADVTATISVDVPIPAVVTNNGLVFTANYAPPITITAIRVNP
jgi:hypothetical protein